MRFVSSKPSSDPLPSLSPKDLPLFYSSFSHSMSHPYTKSQLSEKLRRQRKKFRVISSRLARGLDPSSLSLHDRALFDISRRLWGPEFASTSPFGSNSPGFSHDHEINGVAGNGLHDADMKDNVNEPSLCYDFAAGRDEVINGEAFDGVLGKRLMNAFDECFKEVRMIFVKQGVICFDTMEKKWKEQRVSEFDALGRRLRLVIQNSLNRR
ncbi:probable transcription factor At5g28040 [Hibiscus syriacus]|uniref:probable transcription factor At5g28040 n=1 Tax=Hibiscus syriacus TaxID=106335 RepID=UPI0019237C7F|nr:probable transcription factor At5g28040 [Hibiscus syriacus]